MSRLRARGARTRYSDLLELRIGCTPSAACALVLVKGCDECSAKESTKSTGKGESSDRRSRRILKDQKALRKKCGLVTSDVLHEEGTALLACNGSSPVPDLSHS